MRYLGGKTRIVKQIVNYMSAVRDDDMTWVEPFMGSGKVISRVNNPRIGADVNHELISLFKMLQQGYKPPTDVSEDLYNEIKNNQDSYPAHLRGFVSFACSFAGMRWASYAKDAQNTNYALRGYNALMKQKHLMHGVDLYSCDYKSLKIPPRSLIYCDPPYINTAGYGFDFDHSEFYQWCIARANEGHLVFISEYEAPFEMVWSKEVNVTVSKDKVIKKTEKLFRVHKEQQFKLRKY